MDIFFQDPSEVPLPPEEVRIREFNASPWPDGQRVKVYLEVDAFQKRPSVQVNIRDAGGEVLTEVSIVETITRKMEFNMHLRQPKSRGQFKIEVTLYYQHFESVGETEEVEPQPAPERVVVDYKETVFHIPG